MISKNKQNLQITLNRETIKQLEQLIYLKEIELNNKLTKSQYIEFLINKIFQLQQLDAKDHLQELKSVLIKSTEAIKDNSIKENQQKTIKHTNNSFYGGKEESESNTPIQNALIRLKKVMSLSSKQLADKIGISESAIKKYITGKRTPTEEINKLINNLLEENNIKL